MSNIVKIENELISISVSSLGAETQAITSAKGDEWLWNGDPAFWRGRAPILFPIVGMAANNKVTIDGTSFAMDPHGFARNEDFALTIANKNRCRHELTATQKTKNHFPFDFMLAIDHQIDGALLKVSAQVENRDSKEMDFGFGFHPAFCWPLPNAQNRDHIITLENGAAPALVRLKDGLIDPTPLPSPFVDGKLLLKSSDFENDAMIFPEGAGDALTYGVDGGPVLKFRFENLPNLGIWQKVGAPYICIEPWHGMAAQIDRNNAMTERPFNKKLAPGQSTEFSFSVEFPL